MRIIADAALAINEGRARAGAPDSVWQTALHPGGACLLGEHEGGSAPEPQHPRTRRTERAESGWTAVARLCEDRLSARRATRVSPGACSPQGCRQSIPPPQSRRPPAWRGAPGSAPTWSLGNNAIIETDVVVGARCRIDSHAVVKRWTGSGRTTRSPAGRSWAVIRSTRASRATAPTCASQRQQHPRALHDLSWHRAGVGDRDR